GPARVRSGLPALLAGLAGRKGPRRAGRAGKGFGGFGPRREESQLLLEVEELSVHAFIAFEALELLFQRITGQRLLDFRERRRATLRLVDPAGHSFERLERRPIVEAGHGLVDPLLRHRA